MKRSLGGRRSIACPPAPSGQSHWRRRTRSGLPRWDSIGVLTLIVSIESLRSCGPVLQSRQSTRGSLTVSFLIRPAYSRAGLTLLGLAALLIALSACGGGARPEDVPQEPSPAERSPGGAQDSTPTPASDTPVSLPTPTAVAPVPSPSGTSASAEDGPKAPGFSLMSGLGNRVTLDELLEDHEAMVVVFYRGFF